MPIASFKDFWTRACRLDAADRAHVETLWRRGFQGEAIAYVEARTR